MSISLVDLATPALARALRRERESALRRGRERESSRQKERERPVRERESCTLPRQGSLREREVAREREVGGACR
jgi:hypothetical protein